MRTNIQFLSAIGLVFVLLLGDIADVVAKKAKSSKRVVKPENQTITPWEYCEGCKVTVDLYARLALEELKRMQLNGVKQGEIFSAESIVKNMCDNEEFNSQYVPVMKWSCIKVTSDNLTKFLLPWEGSASAATMGTKGNIFDVKKEVCVDTFKACRADIFTKGDVPLEDRSRCNACKLVAADLYAATTIAPTSSSVLDIVENICGKLGFNHKPYSWIESFCDEMVEEFADEIAEAIIFRRKVKESGQYPDKSLGDAVCSQIYDCDEEVLSSGKKNANTKGKKVRSSPRDEMR